jgi:predicted RNase H-like HicB family nuclease
MLKHFQEGHPMQDISFTVHTFKEGKMYVAYVPELDLSSCGATEEEARKNIRDAVRGFVEILEEAGYDRTGDTWRAPEFVSLDRLTLSVK